MRVLLKMSLEGLPPSVNEMYGISKRRKYKSSEVDKWQWKTVTDFKKNYRAETYTGDAEIKITLQTKNKRRWDIDNRVKALQDCLQFAGVIENDAQVQKLEVERIYTNKDVTLIEVIARE